MFMSLDLPNVEETTDILPNKTSQHYIVKHKQFPEELQFILPFDNGNSQYVRFFWHIHKTGGSYVRKVTNLGYKLRPRAMIGSEKEINTLYRRMSGIKATPEELLEANRSCHDHARKLSKASKLGIKKPWSQKQIEGCIPFVSMALPEHRCLPKCLYYLQTPELYLSSRIFAKSPKKARVATLLRYPIDRFISMFTYLKTATWEDNFNPTPLSINEYVLSGEYKKLEWSGNWVVCKLSKCGKTHFNTTTDAHLQTAKDILQNILIGFTDKMNDFFDRIEKYWNIPSFSSRRARKKIMKLSVNVQGNKFSKNVLSPEVLSILEEDMAHDIQLYSYARNILWDKQGQFINSL